MQIISWELMIELRINNLEKVILMIYLEKVLSKKRQLEIEEEE